MFFYLKITFKDKSYIVSTYDLSEEQIIEKIRTLTKTKPAFFKENGEILLFENIKSIEIYSSEQTYKTTMNQIAIDKKATFTDLSKPKPEYFTKKTREIIKKISFI